MTSYIYIEYYLCQLSKDYLNQPKLNLHNDVVESKAEQMNDALPLENSASEDDGIKLKILRNYFGSIAGQ